MLGNFQAAGLAGAKAQRALVVGLAKSGARCAWPRPPTIFALSVDQAHHEFMVGVVRGSTHRSRFRDRVGHLAISFETSSERVE